MVSLLSLTGPSKTWQKVVEILDAAKVMTPTMEKKAAPASRPPSTLKDSGFSNAVEPAIRAHAISHAIVTNTHENTKRPYVASMSRLKF
jgi:hypothetical protein